MSAWIPWRVRRPVRRARNAAARARLGLRDRARRREIATTPARADGLAVFYGVDRMPDPREVVFGGAVKFHTLHRRLPNAPRDFNVLYLGSTSMPIDAAALVRLARRRGAAFVWNQNGVAYRSWYGPGWELENEPRVRLLHEADHVFYQSHFCRLSADRFYGARRGPAEVLHNPVDTRLFAPAPGPRPARPLTLLLGGNQYQRYRLETALEALAAVRRDRRDVRLLVTGALTFARDAEAQAQAMVKRLGLEDAVECVGPYSQEQAPALMRHADILLHPKYNDPCPTVVLEAMASGVPVVYSASGGTPELVGDEAGVGVPAPLDWDSDHPPAADELASALDRVAGRLDEYAQSARARAVERFDAQLWAARHQVVFEELLRS